MKLSEVIAASAVLVPLQARAKWEAIEALAESLVKAGRVRGDRLAALREALFARERSMSTGMEHGVAIPHAALDDLEGVAASLAVCPEGIPFESIDGKPARIIVCLVVPRQQKLLHIRTLAEIARLFSRERIRERVLACTSSEAVLEAIRQEEGDGQAPGRAASP